MFQVTPNAAKTLDAAKRQQQIPDDYGIRIAGTPSAEGRLGISVGFAAEPAATDAVQVQHGTPVYVAAEVAEPLADAALDVTHDISADGQTAPELVLRPQSPDEV
jgi:Fe-S cluster assembly iron-binding protein IscA